MAENAQEPERAVDVGSTRLVMPRLASMTKSEMQDMLNSVWELCDEQRIPKLNGRDKMDLYGRVYQGLVLGLGKVPERYRKRHNNKRSDRRQ